MRSEERLRDASLTATDFDARAAEDPPARARPVVVGGIIGASVAYHLARLGWTDTVVLERSRVSSGTSRHAAGLMTRTRGTHVQTELASYSRDFYRNLAALSGIDAGYYPNGSLSVARTHERLTELRYAITMARHHGLPAVELTPDEIAAVSPLLAAGDLEGGALFDDDATVNPEWVTLATAKAAHGLGVRFVEGARVTGFRVESGRVTGVEGVPLAAPLPRPGAVVTDVTSGLGVLSVTGPRSRELLAGLTDADLSPAAFPFAHALRIDIGWATVLALRISFAGELGWELYAPTESPPVLYDQLVAAGAELGLRHAGYFALDSLRAEKDHVHWGADVGPADTPLEAGLGFTVAADKPGGFIGREALLAATAPRHRLVPLLLADPEPLLYHDESVLQDGRIVGRLRPYPRRGRGPRDDRRRARPRRRPSRGLAAATPD